VGADESAAAKNGDAMKTSQPKCPESYAKALAQGFTICDETFTGELSRRGEYKMERRLDKSTGDREVIYVPYTAKLSVGRPHGYEVERHAYATTEEQRRFDEAVKAAQLERAKREHPAESTVNAAASEKPSEQRFTLEEAFTYDGTGDFASDTAKGVFAVSFLLDSLSKIGSEDVDARTAQGLAYALRAIAKDADKFLTESFRLKEAEHALEKARGREAA
jgi:hypothetical protein